MSFLLSKYRWPYYPATLQWNAIASCFATRASLVGAGACAAARPSDRPHDRLGSVASNVDISAPTLEFWRGDTGRNPGAFYSTPGKLGGDAPDGKPLARTLFDSQPSEHKDENVSRKISNASHPLDEKAADLFIFCE